MILLVEDNEDDVFIMERALMKLALAPTMQTVTNGREALDYLQAAGKYADRKIYPLPALILLDLKLPQVHGFEVLKWISQDPSLSHIPVVILSSSSESKDREKAKTLGAKDFLVKPPTPEVLGKAIQMFMTIGAG